MEAVFAELPLALFSTLAPIAAGTFLALSISLIVAPMGNLRVRTIGKLSLVPYAIALAGFAASLFHLATPTNAPFVLANTGSSPLSNEIAVGVIFLVAATTFVAFGLADRLDGRVRTPLAVVTVVISAGFTWFTGMAYVMSTIESWNTLLVPVQIMGFSLLAGILLGMLLLSAIGPVEGVVRGAYRNLALAGIALGSLVGGAAFLLQVSAVSGMSTPVVEGADVLAEAMGPFAGALMLIAFAGVVGCVGVLRASRKLLAIALLLAVPGIFIARLVFYATRISFGL